MTAQEAADAALLVISDNEFFEKLDEAMAEFVNMQQVEDEFDGDVYECYLETGRGCAERHVIDEMLAPFKDQLTIEAYVEASEIIADHHSLTI